MGQRKQRPAAKPASGGPFIPEALGMTMDALIGDERQALEAALRTEPPTSIPM